MANTKIPVELSSTPGIVDNSDATAITIDSGERVGIGTTSPSSSTKLEINGNGELLRLDGSGGSARSMRFRGLSTSALAMITIDGSFKLHCEDSGTHMEFHTADTERMRIDGSGNVGLGTDSPNTRLEVGGNLTLTPSTKNNSPSASATISDINFVGRTDNTVVAKIRAIHNDNANGTDGQILFFTADNTASTAAAERMRISSTGTLFVGGTAHYSGGSNADDATLAVNGSIIRTGVQVTDFDEAYVSSSRGILEGTSTFQASNSPLVDYSGAGNFFHLTAKTTATSGSASNNYILQVAYGLTGLQYTRYSSNNGSSWSNWLQRTS